eukprot:15400870-Alexandrium_andersonii.AAC.1
MYSGAPGRLKGPPAGLASATGLGCFRRGRDVALAWMVVPAAEILSRKGPLDGVFRGLRNGDPLLGARVH